MKEGFWINYQTGERFEVFDHENWLRDERNATRLGVPPEIVTRFGDFTPANDRVRFLTFVLSNAPVLRVRGHGVDITFEFAAADTAAESKALEAIHRLCEDVAGAQSWMQISNITTGKTMKSAYIDVIQRERRLVILTDSSEEDGLREK